MNFADTSNKTLNIKNKIMKIEITKKKTMKRIKKMAVVFRKALPRKKEKPPPAPPYGGRGANIGVYIIMIFGRGR